MNDPWSTVRSITCLVLGVLFVDLLLVAGVLSRLLSGGF